MQYGEALLHDKDPEQAREAARVLREQLIRHPDDPGLYELYAKASALAGNEIQSAEALAESYFRSGSVKEAMAQLEMLRDRQDLDYYQRSRVTARLEEMRIIMSEFGDDEAG